MKKGTKVIAIIDTKFLVKNNVYVVSKVTESGRVFLNGIKNNPKWKGYMMGIHLKYETTPESFTFSLTSLKFSK